MHFAKEKLLNQVSLPLRFLRSGCGVAAERLNTTPSGNEAGLQGTCRTFTSERSGTSEPCPWSVNFSLVPPSHATNPQPFQLCCPRFNQRDPMGNSRIDVAVAPHTILTFWSGDIRTSGSRCLETNYLNDAIPIVTARSTPTPIQLLHRVSS